MQRFRSIDRESDLATPILIQACLPEGHLARYIVEIVESLDLSAIEQRYAGRGHDAYPPPSLLLALLIYDVEIRFWPVGWRTFETNGRRYVWLGM